MLAQLKDLHRSCWQPSRNDRLSRASRRRHMLIEETTDPHLLARVAPADIDQLLALREDWVLFGPDMSRG